jgi:hypothetical protein
MSNIATIIGTESQQYWDPSLAYFQLKRHEQDNLLAGIDWLVEVINVCRINDQNFLFTRSSHL